MFGLEFLFSTALWALPLAGLPLVLHLLFRRKSPVVAFPTLRFIRASIQRTAARRRVQRWLLLATRMLLLALLIWAIAQPAKMLASGWFAGDSTIAAIVVDTSYSMELKDQQSTLLDRANVMVEDLLRGQLRDSRVAIFKSSPARGEDQSEQLRPVSKIQSEWTALRPQPNPVPLVERIAAATDLLKRQSANGKWLIVISDFQSREFPRALADFPDGRVILLDLQPPTARSAGITRVAIDPEQPIPGVGSEGIVEVAGRASDSRPVTLTLKSLDGSREISRQGPLMANFDTDGRVRVRFPIKLPAERWLLLHGQLEADDVMAWDNARDLLIDIPARRNVTLLENPALPDATRVTKLALDPAEGKLESWPIAVRSAPSADGKQNVLVAILSQWPDAATARRWRDFVRAGGTLVLMTQPGLETTWADAPAEARAALGELLPSTPINAPPVDRTHRAMVLSPHDRLLAKLIEGGMKLDNVSVRRFVPFAVVDPEVTAILGVSPVSGSTARPQPLLLRRPVGTGMVYTLATVPESRFTNLATHPVFLPMLVRMSLRPVSESDAANVELGEPLIVAGSKFASTAQLEIEDPSRQTVIVTPSDDPKGGRRFVFDQADAPGLYFWRRPGVTEPMAIANVQLPAAEAELAYRPAGSVASPGPNTLIARSLEELEGKMAAVSEPAPRWSWAIALVLFLLCLEALMGSISQLWNPIAWRAIFGRSAGSAPA